MGDRFYVVADGELEVRRSGERLGERGAGEFFGEIALVRDVPRTATVTATSASLLFALTRDDFIAAVTGHRGSIEAADAVIRGRLAGAPGAS